METDLDASAGKEDPVELDSSLTFGLVFQFDESKEYMLKQTMNYLKNLRFFMLGLDFLVTQGSLQRLYLGFL